MSIFFGIVGLGAVFTGMESEDNGHAAICMVVAVLSVILMINFS